MLTSDVGQTDRLLGGGVLRLQPLSQQRRSLTLYVQRQLILDEVQSSLLGRSVNQGIQVIPAAKLRNILNITNYRIGILNSQIVHGNTEETTLTLATAHVADIEQTLQSIHRVLYKCLTEHQNYIRVGTSAVSRTHSEHIEQVRLSGLMSQSTILSESEVGRVGQTIHESIHFAFLLFLIDSSWNKRKFVIVSLSTLHIYYIKIFLKNQVRFYFLDHVLH